CLAIAPLSSGLDATLLSICCISSLASTRSVSSTVLSLASDSSIIRCSSPLSASSRTTRPTTTATSDERAHDALDPPVADERAGELLGEWPRKSPIEHPGDLGSREDIVGRRLDPS